METTMPEPRTPEQQQLRDIAGLWWLTLGLGVLSIAAGVIVIFNPGGSLKAIAVIVGIFIVIDGIVALVAAVTGSTDSRGLAAVLGVVSLVFGVLLIRHPTHGVAAIAIFIGIWLIVMGAIRFVLAFGAQEGRGWRLVVAAVEVIAGIVIVSSPGIGVATLALLVGLALIVNGLTVSALGFALRSVREAV
jgi:uncharacterized membrane protein HdeD (DUF308 family)